MAFKYQPRAKIRESKFYYVDKTPFALRLPQNAGYFFLSYPSRFRNLIARLHLQIGQGVVVLVDVCQADPSDAAHLTNHKTNPNQTISNPARLYTRNTSPCDSPHNPPHNWANPAAYIVHAVIVDIMNLRCHKPNNASIEVPLQLPK